MNHIMPILVDMLSPVKETRKSAENEYLSLPILDKILQLRDSTAEECLSHVRSGQEKESTLALVLYYIVRKEMVDGCYPRVDNEKKCFFGRKIGLYEELYTSMQNYRMRRAAYFAHKQYTMFNETVAMGDRFHNYLIRAFFFGLYKSKFLGMKRSIIEDFKTNLNSLEANLFRLKDELEEAFREILALDNRQNPSKRLWMKASVLEVSASLLNRQIARKDHSLIGLFGRAMLSALKEVREGIKEADAATILGLSDITFTNLHIAVMIHPKFVLPGCEDIYGITIQVMDCKSVTCGSVKPAFLEILVTLAENCPNELKYIGQKEYKLCDKNTILTYEECLIRNVLNYIRGQADHHNTFDSEDEMDTEFTVQDFDESDGDYCRARITVLLEPVRNFERFARVVGAKKIWPHIQNLLNEINSNSCGTSIYATLITISYLGDLLKDEIAASHKLIKEVLNIAFMCDSHSMTKVAMCLLNVQLATDIGKSFVRSWQSEAYITSLLKLMLYPTVYCTIPRIFVLRAITSCAECEFPEIQNPAFKEYLPKIIDAVNYLLETYISEVVHIEAIEVRIQAVKAFCALARTGGRLVSEEQVKSCRSKIYRHIEKHEFVVRSGITFRNVTYIQQLFFDALIQLLDYGHRPSSVEEILSCFKKIFDADFPPNFHLEFNENEYEMAGKIYPCTSVAVLANLSPSSLVIFSPIFLPKMNNIVQLAAAEYLDIFKEYTMRNFNEDHFVDSKFLPVEESIKGKENACRLILNLSKYHCDYLEGVGLQKVIDTMLINLTDRMCSATQELASEALPFLLEKFMHENYSIFSVCMFRKVIRCFMKATSNQINPLKCMRLLIKLLELYRYFEEPWFPNKFLEKKVTNLLLGKLKYAHNFIAIHRRGNIINDLVMSKACHMEEIKKLMMKVPFFYLNCTW